MNKPIQISLRAGSRIYVNGAVVRVKNKVTLELLNDVTFLLESHVLQADETHTPLRQLYFILQSMLIDPTNAEATSQLFEVVLASTRQSFENTEVLAGLAEIGDLVTEGRTFEALRLLRSMFDIEDEILSSGSDEHRKSVARITDAREIQAA